MYFKNFCHPWIKRLVDRQQLSFTKFKLLLKTLTGTLFPLMVYWVQVTRFWQQGGCPGHSHFQLTHHMTQLILSAKIAAPLGNIFKKRQNVAQQ